MITSEEKQGGRYLAVKMLYVLLHKETSNHKGDFYCLNCLDSFRTKNKLKVHEKVCRNKGLCGVEMVSEKTIKIQSVYEMDKMLCIIYADLESLIKNL